MLRDRKNERLNSGIRTAQQRHNVSLNLNNLFQTRFFSKKVPLYSQTHMIPTKFFCQNFFVEDIIFYLKAN